MANYKPKELRFAIEEEDLDFGITCVLGVIEDNKIHDIDVDNEDFNDKWEYEMERVYITEEFRTKDEAITYLKSIGMVYDDSDWTQ